MWIHIYGALSWAFFKNNLMFYREKKESVKCLKPHQIEYIMKEVFVFWDGLLEV